MSRVGDVARRLLGRSVVDLAQEVDDALGALAQAQGQEAACQEALRLAQQDVAAAHAKVRAAREALFTEHPHLRGDTDTQPPTTRSSGGIEGAIDVAHPDPTNPALLPGQDPSKFEVVEVDDADDARFTAGVSTVPTGDDEPLPPIVWEEHEA